MDNIHAISSVIMAEIRSFEGVDLHGKSIKIFIRSEKGFQEAGERENLALQRVALEAARFAKGPTVAVSVEQSKDTLRYEIENGAAAGQIPIAQLDIQKTIAELVERGIVPCPEKPGLESMLDRFSACERGPRSTVDKILRVLADFFEKIRETFQWIDRLWERISHSKEKKLKWDIALLSEICGAPLTEKMSLHQALKYMSSLLERERPELSDRELQSRIHRAVEISGELSHLRDHFKIASFNKIVRRLQDEAAHLKGDKLLLPVSYTQKFEEPATRAKKSRCSSRSARIRAAPTLSH